MSSEVQAAQEELIEEFGFFDNWMDRYQYLIDMGRRLPEFPAADRVDANKIKGEMYFGCAETDEWAPQEPEITRVFVDFMRRMAVES